MNNHKVESIFENRRQALLALINPRGRGSIAAVAKKLGVEPNYLSRCLYPVGKKGKKNIGDETVAKLDDHYPGWQKLSGTSKLTARDIDSPPYEDQLITLVVNIMRAVDESSRQRILGAAKLIESDFINSESPFLRSGT